MPPTRRRHRRTNSIYGVQPIAHPVVPVGHPVNAPGFAAVPQSSALPLRMRADAPVGVASAAPAPAAAVATAGQPNMEAIALRAREPAAHNEAHQQSRATAPQNDVTVGGSNNNSGDNVTSDRHLMVSSRDANMNAEHYCSGCGTIRSEKYHQLRPRRFGETQIPKLLSAMPRVPPGQP